MESILKKLQNLSESDFYPYHMPGHKRLGNPYFSLDITEIDDFDNLHHATGMLKEAQERTAKLYGAKESFYLVNGSTCGLLTAIFASFHRGDKVLVARNCHKAVYHGLEIRGIEPVYIYPELDDKYDINVGISAGQVAKIIETDSSANTIKGMILTSPTYEGVTSEIKEIAELLHQNNMILIVDEAHGAHFGFHKAFPQSAVKQGADLVIQSLHKTLPSMTQTALLHCCSDRIHFETVKKYLAVFQTSSPSYIFMAYMDACIRLLEEKGDCLFEAFDRRLESFYKRCEEFKIVSVRKPVRGLADPGKIVISAGKYMSGKDLYETLRSRYKLQPEMYSVNYVLAIMTICDTEDGFERLYLALKEIDGELTEQETYENASDKCQLVQKRMTLSSVFGSGPKMFYLPGEAEMLREETVKLEAAANRISKEYIYLYPPGIPFVVPGEVISTEMLTALLSLRESGCKLQGMSDESGQTIRVYESLETDILGG